MKNLLRVALAFAVASILSFTEPAQASQNSCVMPNTGTVSGLVLVNDITACTDSILSLYSGGSAPSSPKTGQLWLNTSVTPNLLQQYDGANWQTLGAQDAIAHIWNPPVGGGSGSLTAAATTDLCSVAPSLVTMGGTTTVTSFGSNCVLGVRKTIIFSAATPITYNVTSMIIPGQVSYTATIGDVAEAVYLGAGNWRIIDITKLDGTSITNPAVPLGTMLFGMYATAPAKFVLATGQPLTRSSFPAYLAAVTRAQVVTTTSGNNTLTSVPNTAGLGAGMPLEGTNIPAGTTIVSVTSSTIVMSANASAGGTPTVTAFLTGYGAGGSTSTVGVPDCRGRVIAGRDDMLGTAANRITSAISGILGTADNASGGSQAFTIAQSGLPNVAFTVTGTVSSTSSAAFFKDNGGSITAAGFFNGGGGLVYYMNGTPTPSSGTVTSSGSLASGTTTSLNGNVTQTASPLMQPTLIAECVIAVSP